MITIYINAYFPTYQWLPCQPFYPHAYTEIYAPAASADGGGGGGARILACEI